MYSHTRNAPQIDKYISKYWTTCQTFPLAVVASHTRNDPLADLSTFSSRCTHILEMLRKWTNISQNIRQPVKLPLAVVGSHISSATQMDEYPPKYWLTCQPPPQAVVASHDGNGSGREESVL
jgi:hypothetical protein